MSGNVFEWCADWYNDQYYKNSSLENPNGLLAGYQKVLHGGCWYNKDNFNKPVSRFRFYLLNGNIDYGFRIVKDL